MPRAVNCSLAALAGLSSWVRIAASAVPASPLDTFFVEQVERGDGLFQIQPGGLRHPARFR